MGGLKGGPLHPRAYQAGGEAMISNLPREDRELIMRFTELVKSWAPPTLSNIVLFGSTVRGDFGVSSDIDVLMVFDEPNPGRYLSEITKLITKLKPRR